MKVGIFIPSLYRSQNLTELILSYERTTDINDVEFDLHFMIPEDDYKSYEVLKALGYDAWRDSSDMRFVTRIQFMYDYTDNDWFLTGADDILFQPGWYQSAQTYMDHYSVISFEDLCNPNVPGTNFLIKRQYIREQSGVIDSPNTVFCQEYFHNFCDNELVGTAKKREQFVKCGGVIEHFHWTVGKGEDDAIYKLARSHWDDDAALFNSRAVLWS